MKRSSLIELNIGSFVALLPVTHRFSSATTWTLETSVIGMFGSTYSTISAPYLNELYTFQAVNWVGMEGLEGSFIARPSNK